MRSDDFLNEVLNYDKCPEGFETMYKEFLIFQDAAIATLKEFHRVCEKNSINYQLAYGSLLGVIRDGGQIPWDYDIDVIVPQEERQKLVESLKKDLDDSYYFYSMENHSNCRHMIMRLAPNEYRSEALHVDVFFLTGTPENEADRRVFAKRMAELSEMRYGKCVNIKEASMGSFRRYISLFRRRKLPLLFTSLDKIDKEYKKMCEKYSSFGSTVCISADSYAEWADYPTELLWDTEIVDTAYGQIRIPVHYKELLELEYGDYLSIPSLEDRIGEVQKNYRRIKHYNSISKR